MSTSTKSPNSSRGAAKALAAAGLAVVLLAGTGGTFALWSDSESVSTGTITDGSLSLDVTPGSWAQLDGTPIEDITAFRMVPGDTAVFEATATPTIVGDNLEATLVGEFVDDAAHWDVEAVLPDGGLLNAEDSGVAHDVRVTVSLPVTSGNESQEQVLDLGSIALTLQQVDPSVQN